MQTICNAPAKLIVTGEYAVLNNIAAFCLAINFNTSCDITFKKNENNNLSFAGSFNIELVNYQEKFSFSSLELHNKSIYIEGKFQQYMDNILSINAVLTQPIDLILICLYHFHNKHHLKQGNWQIKITGHQLLGRGLGSSASVIVALLVSLYKQHNLIINKAEVLQLAMVIESRQHGQSSGLDPATVLFGGLIKYRLKQPIKPLKIEKFNAWIIDTGIANSSTGQCVDFVKNNFAKSHHIWQKFKQVSLDIEKAWLTQNNILFKKTIAYNQQLLEQIGVVPNKVKKFLASLDANSTAKICGAGAINGDNAGIILYIGDPPTKLCEEYGYNILPISLNLKGTICEMVN